eukprot:gene1643-1986_t
MSGCLGAVNWAVNLMGQGAASSTEAAMANVDTTQQTANVEGTLDAAPVVAAAQLGADGAVAASAGQAGLNADPEPMDATGGASDDARGVAATGIDCTKKMAVAAAASSEADAVKGEDVVGEEQMQQ